MIIIENPIYEGVWSPERHDTILTGCLYVSPTNVESNNEREREATHGTLSEL